VRLVEAGSTAVDVAASVGNYVLAIRKAVGPTGWLFASRSILFIGPISSLFDYTTFFVMLYVFDCWDPSRAAVFQTGWFAESLSTQSLIIHVIHTNKIPFLQSRASWPLTMTTLAVIAFGVWLPYSPLAPALG